MKMSSKTFVIFALALFVIFNFITLNVSAQSIPGCQAYGIDLSPLADADLIYQPSGSSYLYVIRPCAAVTDALCSNDSTSNHSMVCQRTNVATNDAYGLSFWNNSQVIYSRTNHGIYQELITGEGCGSTTRQTKIYYFCDSTATSPQIVSVFEHHTCHYEITINTNLTCDLPVEPDCTFDGIDLHPMFVEGELTFNNSYAWYLRMCSSSPTNFLCHNDSTAYDSMICQQYLDGGDSYGIAVYNEDTVEWRSVPTGNNAGLEITVNDGEYCGAIGANRSAVIQLVCDPTLESDGSYITGESETMTCVYQFTIRTSLACPVVRIDSSSGAEISLSSSWWPISGIGSCSMNGFNFQSLYFVPDLTWGGFIGNTYYQYFFHMCGVVRNAQCLQDGSTYNSMICQASATNPADNLGLDYFVPNDWVWTNTTYGTQYTSQLGELCGSNRRTTTVDFTCDPNEPGRLDRITQSSDLCDYTVYITTRAVCTGTNQPPSSTGPQPPIPDCVYNGWDFKSINPPHGDLTFNAIGSTNYTIYIRMCSVVDQLSCRRDFTSTQAMVCQSRQDGSNAYSLGDWDPWYQNWTEIASDQIIQVTLDNGESCGSTPRKSILNFTCDPNYTEQTGNSTGIVYFGENPGCTYHINIVANNLICPYFNGSHWNLTSSSSSTGSAAGSTSLSSTNNIFSSSSTEFPSGSSTGFDTGSSESSGNVLFSSSSSSSVQGCIISSDDAPDGAVAVAMVFNFTLGGGLPNNFYSILFTGLESILSGANFVCGSATSGDRISNTINGTTASQTIVTFYLVGDNAAQQADQLSSLLQNNPSAVAIAVSDAGRVDTNQYEVVPCPAGEVADFATGTCRPRAQQDNGGSGGLSDGAIAGIVVGCVVGGLLIIALLICLIVRGRKSSSEGGHNIEMTKA